MRRRFSTFPDGWPGRGLLLLRLGAGVPLIYLGIHGLSESLGEPITVARDLTESAGGVLLLAGLWTPLAGAMIAIQELWIAFSMHFSQHGQHVFLAVLSAGLAMLGPGAWSVDARLFGRKVFDSEDLTRRW
jgi:putative oxidoreductase